MKQYSITKPVGLTSLCQEIETVCQKAHIYRRCGIKPSHLLIPLDPGCGRTTFIQYMADMYKKHGVLEFGGGLDDVIEITLSGTLPQLKQAFAAIDAAAVYTNTYSSIVAIDISSIGFHLNETQCSELLARGKKVCAHALAAFFVHSIPSRNEQRLMEKLCKTIENIKRLHVEPYTRNDICELILRQIKDRGIQIKHEKAFLSALQDMVTELCISTVKEAVLVANGLVHYADFSSFVPTADENSLKMLAETWQYYGKGGR